LHLTLAPDPHNREPFDAQPSRKKMSTRSSSSKKVVIADVGLDSSTSSFRVRNNWTSYAALQSNAQLTETLTLAERIERMGRALNAGELADLLNVSKITIFKQAKGGRIPSFRIGTCVRFDPKVVAKWLRTM
jgi:excisionase family DNA binding protein